MLSVKNLFMDIPAEVPNEICTQLVRADAVRIERIVTRGQASPPGFWYDQETNEWVLLVKGNAVLRVDNGREVALVPGDHVLIMSNGAFENIHQRLIQQLKLNLN